MKGPRALDEEIRRAEEDIARHRRDMQRALEASDERFRDAVATPKVLIAAAVAGFAIDRLTGRSGTHKLKHKHKTAAGHNGAANGTAEVAQRAGMTALLGTAATALLRQQLMTPGSMTRRYLTQFMRRAPITPADKAH